MGVSKLVLGLDLGVSSIGWAIVQVGEGDVPQRIIDMGSRIIPLDSNVVDEFNKGTGESVNQKRTVSRGIRRGYDRYQQRRFYLKEMLTKLSMLPPESLYLNTPLELYGLRAKAVTDKLSLEELGRVLFHLNQKRGYRSNRKDQSGDKKETEYVAALTSRHAAIREQGLTVGQWIYQQLQADPHFRVKEKVFPRQAYIDEFNAIWDRQAKEYPSVLTQQRKLEVRDSIIFYQRPLKSQKGLVSRCELEKQYYTAKDSEKKVDGSPRVAPRSSPLNQLCILWENINKLRIGVPRSITDLPASLVADGKGEASIAFSYRKQLVEYLSNHPKLTQKELFKLLGISESDGYTADGSVKTGIKGDGTRAELFKILKDNPRVAELMKLELEEVTYEWIDKPTGEVVRYKRIHPKVENQPLYRLWHAIYSIPEADQLVKVLKAAPFDLSEEEAVKLAGIDFTKSGFASKCTKAIRNILPYLMQGYMYSEACAMAGYNHSGSVTKEEKEGLEPSKDSLLLLPKNSLRQPVVEKVLNQMILQVNAIREKYGMIDEIHVELARELKKSKEQRERDTKNMRERERENDRFAEQLKEYGARVSKRNKQKMRMLAEVDCRCLYCGEGINPSHFLHGEEADIEHIIPSSLLFDDSLQNKIPSHRACNAAKGQQTAYEYMRTQPKEQLERYEAEVSKLYKSNKISKTKQRYLLMDKAHIPDDFIDRQLRQTQYITRKACEILSPICKDVLPTGGTVTERLRHLWGWDEVLMESQLESYRLANLTYEHAYQSNGQTHKEERITDWSKRNDHRHHAIDALTVACTSRSFIQRLNTLSSQQTQQELKDYVAKKIYNQRLNKLEKFLIDQQPFDTSTVRQKVDEIFVSFKAGKRVASIATRKVKKGRKKETVQKGIVVPRGALSEETLYGMVKKKEFAIPVAKLFENPDTIFKPYIRDLVVERLALHGGDVKKAVASVKTAPIYLDTHMLVPLTHATILADEIVVRKPLDSLDEKQVEKIIDDRVRELARERIKQYGGKAKEAFKDLVNNPVWLNEEKGIAVKKVRIRTGLTAVVPIYYNEAGKPTGYVKPGNNHHIAIYGDENGILQEQVVTFWEAVERKKYKLPIVIDNPKQVWDMVLNNPDGYPESLLKSLPADSWQLVTSIQQNEMFVFGLTKEELQVAIDQNDSQLVSKCLYRVQKIASCYYNFRHHLETRVDDAKLHGEKAAIKMGKMIRISSLKNMTGIKVKVDRLGKVSM